MHEKRRHPRAYAPATVSVFSAGRLIGVYLVQNLSAGGALLVGGSAIAAGAEVRLVVRILGRCVIEVGATVLRQMVAGDGLVNLAVMFRHGDAHLEEKVRTAVTGAFRREGDSSVLIIHRSTAALVSLADAVLESGRQALLAFTALEAMRWLCNQQVAVAAVVMDARFDVDGGRTFLRFLREEFPHIRRLVVHDATGAGEVQRHLDSRDAEGALMAPWTSSDINAALTL